MFKLACNTSDETCITWLLDLMELNGDLIILFIVYLGLWRSTIIMTIKLAQDCNIYLFLFVLWIFQY